jgi:TPR repeat protein
VSLTQLERDCDAGKAQACLDAGDLERDANHGATMISLYGKACALNDGRGCYHVGYAYQFGNRVLQDERRAMAAYEQGCALGNDGSCAMVKSAQH